MSLFLYQNLQAKLSLQFPDMKEHHLLSNSTDRETHKGFLCLFPCQITSYFEYRDPFTDKLFTNFSLDDGLSEVKGLVEKPSSLFSVGSTYLFLGKWVKRDRSLFYAKNIHSQTEEYTHPHGDEWYFHIVDFHPFADDEEEVLV